VTLRGRTRRRLTDHGLSIQHHPEAVCIIPVIAWGVVSGSNMPA
jgi:hypothetical protein